MSESVLLLYFVDLALLISTAELLWLLSRRSTSREQLALLAHLGAGLALMMALRLGLAGAGLWPVASCLACSGMAHVFDSILRRRTAGALLKPQESSSP